MGRTPPAADPSPARAGRRGASSTARDDIAREARRLFGELGYDHASLRQVAEAAGVDVALISYFFGSKQQLFVEVIDLPVDPEVVLPRILGGDRERVGEALAALVLDILSTPELRARVLGMIRSASSQPDAAELVRERLTRQLLLPIAGHLGADDAELRAGLVMSQVVGFTFARHVVGLEVLAEADRAVLGPPLARTLQHYLTGELTGELG
jgi:AcrR family transcriptional regulator